MGRKSNALPEDSIDPILGRASPEDLHPFDLSAVRYVDLYTLTNSVVQLSVHSNVGSLYGNS
jgi:hypothetical protein